MHAWNGLLGIGIILAASHAQAAPTTIVAGSCRPASPSAPTIQQAVNTAGAGGTVLVCPGNYPEQVTIAKSLTLQGLTNGNTGQPVIVAPSHGMVANATGAISGGPLAVQLLVKGGAAVTVNNLTINGTGNAISACSINLIGILYQSASGAITGNAVINEVLTASQSGCQGGNGIVVQSGKSGQSVVTISGNHVQNYEKNGITANEPGTNVVITANTVIGQGLTSGTAQNAIQVGFGATARITSNVVGDNARTPSATQSDGNAATGILGYASTNLMIAGNIASDTQFGIAVGGQGNGGADRASITGNRIQAVHGFDGVNVCGSSSNVIASNTIDGADQSGIHIDSACSAPSLNNTVVQNIVNLSCAAILVGAGSTVPTTTNILRNASNLILTDTDACPSNSVKARPEAARP